MRQIDIDNLEQGFEKKAMQEFLDLRQELSKVDETIRLLCQVQLRQSVRAENWIIFTAVSVLVLLVLILWRIW